MFDKVILAVDGSPESLKAAQLVEALAERFKGEMLSCTSERFPTPVLRAGRRNGRRLSRKGSPTW
jgi:hypothetical protein